MSTVQLEDTRRAIAKAMPGTEMGHATRDDTAIARSVDDDGLNYVRVLKLKKVDPSTLDDPGGEIVAEVRYEETFTDTFDAGYQFRYLEEKLARAEPTPLPGDPLEREIQKREYLEAYAEICRFQFTEEMKEEARKLAAGETDYPPEESILGEILKEIDALP